MANLINLYAKTFDYVYDYSADQDFLSKYILPFYKKDCIDYSSHKKIVWEHTVPFPKDCANKYGSFVGDRVSPFETAKIDVYSHSVDSENIYLFCHQSPSDFKSCNALIRYFSEKYKNVIVPSKHTDLVSKMIEDVPNVKVLPISDDNQGMKYYLDIYSEEYKFVGVGLLSEHPDKFDMSNPKESFYNQFDLNKKEQEQKYNLC